MSRSVSHIRMSLHCPCHGSTYPVTRLVSRLLLPRDPYVNATTHSRGISFLVIPCTILVSCGWPLTDSLVRQLLVVADVALKRVV